MEQNSPAEELPALYRAILDRVAGLEADGDRPGAARLRASATRLYSRAWDQKTRRGLERLLRDATKAIPARQRSRTEPDESAARRDLHHGAASS